MDNKTKKLQAEVNDLNTAILKSRNSQKILNLLLGEQKQLLDKHGIGYDESNEIILLKSNIFSREFTVVCLVCGGNDHLIYAFPYKNLSAKSPKMKWAVKTEIIHDNFYMFIKCLHVLFLFILVHVSRKTLP